MDTDTRYLSVGMAQWDESDVSLKIMRYTGSQWSRQAEELPLHRVFDSALFVAKVLFDSENNSVEFDKHCFANQNNAIQVTMEIQPSDQLNNFNHFILEKEHFLKSRLNSLYQVLDNLKKRGRF